MRLLSEFLSICLFLKNVFVEKGTKVLIIRYSLIFKNKKEGYVNIWAKKFVSSFNILRTLYFYNVRLFITFIF